MSAAVVGAMPAYRRGRMGCHAGAGDGWRDVGSVPATVARTVRQMPTTKTLLAVDGNSLVHRSFHTLKSSGLATRDGRPTWAVMGFLSQLLGALDRTGADAVIVGFDDPTTSLRRQTYPDYKAKRPPKPAELTDQLATAVDVSRSLGFGVVVPPGLEADDVMASAAAYAPTVGWRTVVMTSDRDSFALIDEHTRVLRLINGGLEMATLLTPDRLNTMLGIGPDQYQEYAALRGDTSDNLPGVRRVGEKTAAKLLAAFGSVQAAFDDVDAGGARVSATLGKSFVTILGDPDQRAAFHRNMQIMAMRKELPLGVDLTTGPGVLPLPVDQVLSALDALELTSLREQALRLLCGVAPDAPTPEAEDLPSGWEPPLQEPPTWEASPQEPPSWAEPEPALPAMQDLATVGAMRGSTAPRPSNWSDML